MARENLFRGRHIHALENRHLDGTWVYGYLCNENHIYSPESEGEFLIDPETVCRYTGTTDEERRKIFEGDIVKENGAIGIVKFGRYGNGFHLGCHIYWINFPHLRNEICYWEGKVRVIGNIFDNPELTKEG